LGKTEEERKNKGKVGWSREIEMRGASGLFPFFFFLVLMGRGTDGLWVSFGLLFQSLAQFSHFSQLLQFLFFLHFLIFFADFCKAHKIIKRK